MLHTKALLIDDVDVVIVGSSNFDQRSFRLNFELSLLIEDNKVATNSCVFCLAMLNNPHCLTLNKKFHYTRV